MKDKVIFVLKCLGWMILFQLIPILLVIAIDVIGAWMSGNEPHFDKGNFGLRVVQTQVSFVAAFIIGFWVSLNDMVKKVK